MRLTCSGPALFRMPIYRHMTIDGHTKIRHNTGHEQDSLIIVRLKRPFLSPRNTIIVARKNTYMLSSKYRFRSFLILPHF